MGSSIGHAKADFYLFNPEIFLLSQDRTSNPIFYVRYVDDDFSVLKMVIIRDILSVDFKITLIPLANKHRQNDQSIFEVVL